MSIPHVVRCLLGLALLGAATRLQAAEGISHGRNYDEAKVGTYTLPDPLLTRDGRRIVTADEWRTLRRGEILRDFRDLMYGHTPILQRGYAVATFYYGDVEPDHLDGWRDGIRGYALKLTGRSQRASHEWGALGAWAWGLSRALDYLETDPRVDARRVAVFGHSRQGKAALWAGAQDERFALVISNNSGEGGASLARRNYGENIAYSIFHASWRYCDRFRDYIDRSDELPFDQHMLIGLIAPRPVYVASASADGLADPQGEFLSAAHAEPVYRLFGRRGLATFDWPPPDRPIGDAVAYHVRTGPHAITPYDWEQYLNFAERHLGRANQDAAAR